MDPGAIEKSFPELKTIRLLVKSGQKEVFAANKDGGPVVLKLIKEGTADDERVKREIAAVAKLDSPYVPKIFEHGTREVGGTPRFFLVEQFVEGGSFRQYLQRVGKLDLPAALVLADRLLDACATFEKHRLVHRDIKPENLMVDATGKIWVIDFGLVRMLDLTSLTATSDKLAACTPGYAAPEQFRNRKIEINARADLFSIGIVLYEALHGGNPYVQGKRHALDVIQDVESRDLPRKAISGDVKGLFEEFLAALTSRFPTRRPQSAAEALTWFREVEKQIRATWTPAKQGEG